MSVSAVKVRTEFVLVLSMCASLLLLPGTAPAHETGTRPKLTLPAQVDLDVPLAPTPVKMNGKQCLVYELHITNFSTNRVELMRAEVLGDVTTGPPLASYTGEELTRQMVPAPFRPKLHEGHAVVGVCPIRLEQIRPRVTSTVRRSS